MTRRTHRLTMLATAALALSLTACGGDSESSSTVTVTQTRSPEQQALTNDQVVAALPTREDAPNGFRPDDAGFTPTTDSERSTSPRPCIALYMQTEEMRDFTTAHLGAQESVKYVGPSQEFGTPSTSVVVWSHDEPYPTDFFDEAGAALGDCKRHTSKLSAESAEVEWTAASIPTPTLGDQSFGVRIGQPEYDLAVDYLWVRSGHNLIHVRIDSEHGANNDAELKRYAQGVLDELKKQT